jgi:hypothetical protein
MLMSALRAELPSANSASHVQHTETHRDTHARACTETCTYSTSSSPTSMAAAPARCRSVAERGHGGQARPRPFARSFTLLGEAARAPTRQNDGSRYIDVRRLACAPIRGRRRGAARKRAERTCLQRAGVNQLPGHVELTRSEGSDGKRHRKRKRWQDEGGGDRQGQQQHRRKCGCAQQPCDGYFESHHPPSQNSCHSSALVSVSLQGRAMNQVLSLADTTACSAQPPLASSLSFKCTRSGTVTQPVELPLSLDESSSRATAGAGGMSGSTSISAPNAASIRAYRHHHE